MQGTDLLHLSADPDPAYHFNRDTDPIILLIKVMRICDLWNNLIVYQYISSVGTVVGRYLFRLVDRNIAVS
jgi:hypothetical protein